jgi:hypothetical protein
MSGLPPKSASRFDGIAPSRWIFVWSSQVPTRLGPAMNTVGLLRMLVLKTSPKRARR